MSASTRYPPVGVRGSVVHGEALAQADQAPAVRGGCTTVSGRWIEKPGEAVVPIPFLTATGTRVGDTVTVNGPARPVAVRIVGEVLDPHSVVSVHHGAGLLLLALGGLLIAALLPAGWAAARSRTATALRTA
ncbi:hypothetical protein [Streptomyces sp. bgisy082]|uniref:hypothetical protein n=1 Tax=Streptomyces sp. bgisy082 TaxID=3413776 RepID=UPI003D743A05